MFRLLRENIIATTPLTVAKHIIAYYNLAVKALKKEEIQKTCIFLTINFNYILDVTPSSYDSYHTFWKASKEEVNIFFILPHDGIFFGNVSKVQYIIFVTFH